jgi:hypothetical protein
MTQALYAHMNNKRKKKGVNKREDRHLDAQYFETFFP